MSLLSFPGEVVVFLTYGMHFSGTQAELGDIRKMGTTFRAPSLLAGPPPHAALPIPRPDGAGPRGPAPRRREAGGSGSASRCCRGTRPPDPPSLASAPRNAAPRAY